MQMSISWRTWLTKYSEIFEDPTCLTAISCPHCASSDLNLVMVVRDKDVRHGWGVFGAAAA